MNMTKPRIKICGLQHPELAYKTARSGANYIGLVFYKHSKRHVNVCDAIEISRAIRRGGAQPVAIVVDQSADEMLAICNKANIDIIQLHGEKPRKEHHSLPKEISRIYVLPIDHDGSILNDSPKGFDALEQSRDFILFDGLHGGSGKTINMKNIQHYSSMRFFIAGGLRFDNVHSIAEQYKPYGIDISTGVENEKGVKDIKLIKQVLTEVSCRHCEERSFEAISIFREIASKLRSSQ